MTVQTHTHAAQYSSTAIYLSTSELGNLAEGLSGNSTHAGNTSSLLARCNPHMHHTASPAKAHAHTAAASTQLATTLLKTLGMFTMPAVYCWQPKRQCVEQVAPPLAQLCNGKHLLVLTMSISRPCPHLPAFGGNSSMLRCMRVRTPSVSKHWLPPLLGKGGWNGVRREHLCGDLPSDGKGTCCWSCLLLRRGC